MKNIFKYILLALTVVLFASCDQDYWNEDNFEKSEYEYTPTDVQVVEYTLTASDYSAVASNSTNKNLAGDALSSALKAVGSKGYFSDDITAKDYLPAFMSTSSFKYFTLDEGADVKVTYNKLAELPANYDKIFDAGTYTVSADNYKSVWGEVDAKYFTPSQASDKWIPKFLAAEYPNAASGDYKIVAYDYSLNEPNTGGATVKLPTSIYEDFSTATVNADLAIDGWQNVAKQGSVLWQGKTFSGNNYTQFTANGTTGEIEGWLISPKVDLSEAADPQLAFDLCIGYFNQNCLSVLVSTDYNGSDIDAATWTDVTYNFAIPVIPTSGYGKSHPVGTCSLAGLLSEDAKTVYVAFKYVGRGAANGSLPKATTTYQIDNVQIGDDIDVATTQVFSDDFATLDNWSQQSVQGTYKWQSKSYSGNFYAQFSANGSTGIQENWLVSKEIAVPASTGSGASDVAELKFDVTIGYWNANCLSVLVSTDYVDDVTNATWTDMTGHFLLPQTPTGGYGKSASAGACPLDAFAGKNIRVAFKYLGNGVATETDPKATTTYQIDNVNISTYTHVAAPSPVSKAAVEVKAKENCLAVYTYNGSAWVETEDATVVNPSDYESMGVGSYISNVDNYLPAFLAQKFPYAQEGDEMMVVYQSSSSAKNVAYFHFVDGEWLNATVETVTEKFSHSEKGWVYNPSVYVTLNPNYKDGNATFVKAFYQSIVTWVGTNKDTKYYQKSSSSYYTNADYYFGATAYRLYFAFNPTLWKSDSYGASDDYKSMSDLDIRKLQYVRLKEALVHGLEASYSDLAPVAGTEITATAKFAIFYDSPLANIKDESGNYEVYTHEIVYTVVGKGQFEFKSIKDLRSDDEKKAEADALGITAAELATIVSATK